MKKLNLNKKYFVIAVMLIVFLSACAESVLPANDEITPVPVTLPIQADVVINPTATPTRTSLLMLVNTPTPTLVNTATLTPTSLQALAIKLNGTVASVIDVLNGNVIVVKIDGVYPSYVKYIGISSPKFSNEATQANIDLVAGQTVILVKDILENDKHGRLLRYVYLTDGTFVNAELVRIGIAKVATAPPNTTYQGDFLLQQSAAQRGKVGLWAEDGTVATAFPTPLINTSTPHATTISAPTPTVVLQPTGIATPIPTPTVVLQPTLTPVPVPATPTDVPVPTEVSPTVSPPLPAQVVFAYIYFDGQAGRNEPDEYAEIVNQGGAAINLAGWRLNADDNGQDFWFPAFNMQPGQHCRIYTNENHQDSCGFSFWSGKSLWANGGECGHLYNAEGVEVSTYCY